MIKSISLYENIFMTNFRPYFLLVNLLFCFGLLANCQSVDVRGQYINDEMVKKINQTKPTQAELVRLVGMPTFVPDYSRNNWYYIQRSIARRSWLKPKILNQRIVKITFNKKKKVLSAQLFQDKYNSAIRAESRFTRTRGTEQTTLQKFTQNFGRFVGKKKKKRKK